MDLNIDERENLGSWEGDIPPVWAPETGSWLPEEEALPEGTTDRPSWWPYDDVDPNAGAGTGSSEAGTGSGSGDTGSGTGSSETGTGSGSGDTGSGTGSTGTGTGSGSGDTGSGTGSTGTGTGSGSGDTGSGTGSTGTGTGSGSGDTGSGTGSTGTGTGSGSGDTGSETGSTGTGTGSGSGDTGSGTGSTGTGTGSGSGDTGSGTGSTGTGTGSGSGDTGSGTESTGTGTGSGSGDTGSGTGSTGTGTGTGDDKSDSWQAGYDAFNREQQALDDYANGYEQAKKEYEEKHPQPDPSDTNTTPGDTTDTTPGGTTDNNNNSNNNNNNTNDGSNNSGQTEIPKLELETPEFTSPSRENTSSSNTNTDLNNPNVSADERGTTTKHGTRITYNDDGTITFETDDDKITLTGAGTSNTEPSDQTNTGTTSTTDTTPADSTPSNSTAKTPEERIAEAQAKWNEIDAAEKAGTISAADAAAQKAQAHNDAEAARAELGYSGGADGSQHLPLNNDGSTTNGTGTDALGSAGDTGTGSGNGGSGAGTGTGGGSGTGGSGSGTGGSGGGSGTGGSGTGTGGSGSGNGTGTGNSGSGSTSDTPERRIAAAQAEWNEAERALKAGEITAEEAAQRKEQAHANAEAARAELGFSGGADGSQYLPLNETDQTKAQILNGMDRDAILADIEASGLSVEEYAKLNGSEAVLLEKGIYPLSKYEGFANMSAEEVQQFINDHVESGEFTYAELLAADPDLKAKLEELGITIPPEVLAEYEALTGDTGNDGGTDTTPSATPTGTTDGSTNGNESFTLDVEKAAAILSGDLNTDFKNTVNSIKDLVTDLTDLQNWFYSPADKDTTLIYSECAANIGVGSTQGLYPAIQEAHKWASAVDQYVQGKVADVSQGDVYNL